MLKPAIESYLAARRAVGFKLREAGRVLQDFAAFAADQGDTHVCTHTVFDWIRARNGSRLNNCVRLRTVVRFARYAHADDERHEVPSGKAFGSCTPQRQPPFLFTPDQVQQLVRAARTPGPNGSLQPHTYSTLFGLLAATGLRISEALNLRLDDITSEGLIIRNTKFNKSRLLPLHPTTRARLAHYLERRLQEAGACSFVFVSIKGRKLHANTGRGVFHRLVISLGIATRKDKPRPRVHDLRFYFANQALTNGPGDHDGISRHMIALTTYLGHCDVRNSYWYLEATASLFAKVAETCESFAIGVKS
jgi:integrase/recombinase XerD